MRGGYGAARILEYLDYDMIAKHPKAFIGYSDITALHIVLGERSKLATIHAPMFLSLINPQNTSYTHEQFFAGLRSTNPLGEIPMPPDKTLTTIVPGKAEGVITGGNLTVIASLVGTPYELDGKGTLLLLEEVGEKVYRIDRMLNQLWQNGLLSRVNGILLGDFVDCNGGSSDDDSYTLELVLNNYAKLSGKPVIKGVPASHGEDNAFIPFGVHAVMNAQENEASLIIDEAIFTH